MDSKKEVVYIPKEGLEGDKFAIASLLVSVGEAVVQFQPIAEINTDKAVVEVPAPCSGIVSDILVQEGDEVDFDTPIATIQQVAENQEKSESEQVNNVASKDGVRQEGQVTILETDTDNQVEAESNYTKQSEGYHPSVYTYANFYNLKPEEALLKIKQAGEISDTVETKIDLTSAYKIPGEMRPLSKRRKEVAKRMAVSYYTAPHVTSVFRCELDRVIAHREKQLKENNLDKRNLTLSAYFILAAAKALEKVPEINSVFTKEGLYVFHEINIGIGVALENEGIVVPVIKDANKKTLLEIGAELQDLIDRSRQQKLTANDITGGTFTISNHGVSGSLLATPIIIHQPQTAILGIGKMEKLPLVKNKGGREDIVAVNCCYVTLTIDHRSVDAFQTNKFLSILVSNIENVESN